MANGRGHTGHRWRTLRATVLAARPLICALCGFPIEPTLSGRHPFGPSVDCEIPVSRGGSPTDLANLRPAHLICNQKRGNTMVNTEIQENTFTEVVGLDP